LSSADARFSSPGDPYPVISLPRLRSITILCRTAYGDLEEEDEEGPTRLHECHELLFSLHPLHLTFKPNPYFRSDDVWNYYETDSLTWATILNSPTWKDLLSITYVSLHLGRRPLHSYGDLLYPRYEKIRRVWDCTLLEGDMNEGGGSHMALVAADEGQGIFLLRRDQVGPGKHIELEDIEEIGHEVIFSDA
jgi:hypothetical protein